ncbi:MAG: histidine phosphotransferase family protein [Ehrlichia sp.]
MRKNDVLSSVELVSARLLHDLAGSVGAIVNYIECLSDDENLSEDMIPLLSDAANDVISKFKLLKQAYSISDDNGDFNSTKCNIESYLKGKKVILEWDINIQIFDVELVEKINKLLANTVMVLMLFMISGSKVKVILSKTETGDLLIETVAHAQKVEMHESIKNILDKNLTDTELTTKNIQARFLMLLLDNYNAKMTYNIQESFFNLSICLS